MYDPTTYGTVTISAYYVHYDVDDAKERPSMLEARASFATPGEASVFKASFPVACRVRSYGVSCYDYENDRRADYAGASFHAKLVKDESNGGFNESGVKRYRRFRKQLDAMGYRVEWKVDARNAYESEDEFEAALVVAASRV